jgi:hypothetical protein
MLVQVRFGALYVIVVVRFSCHFIPVPVPVDDFGSEKRRKTRWKPGATSAGPLCFVLFGFAHWVNERVVVVPSLVGIFYVLSVLSVC